MYVCMCMCVMCRCMCVRDMCVYSAIVVVSVHVSFQVDGSFLL